MAKKINRPLAAFFGAIARIASKAKSNAKLMWFLGLGFRWALVLAAVVLYTLVIFRAAQSKALKTYEGWFEAYKIEQAEAEAQARAAALASDPYEIQLNEEAEALAKVLYGVKDNSTDDLKTYCWCVLNRVDNPNYPDTLQDVIAQPSQWMRYDATNPIIESLYQLAREQLDEWHSNTHRPVSNEYVFMNWTRNDICLRDNFYEGSGTHYWRYGQ